MVQYKWAEFMASTIADTIADTIVITIASTIATIATTASTYSISRCVSPYIGTWLRYGVGILPAQTHCPDTTVVPAFNTFPCCLHKPSPSPITSNNQMFGLQ